MQPWSMKDPGYEKEMIILLMLHRSQTLTCLTYLGSKVTKLKNHQSVVLTTAGASKIREPIYIILRIEACVVKGM